jgi:hypothetical protein
VTREIGTSARFGHGDRRHQVSVCQPGEPAITLAVVCVGEEVGETDVVVERDLHARPSGSRRGELFADDRVVSEVVDTASSVLLGNGHAEKAAPTRLAERRLVDDAGLLPFLSVGEDLGGDEVAKTLPKEVVLRVEDGALHAVTVPVVCSHYGRETWN